VFAAWTIPEHPESFVQRLLRGIVAAGLISNIFQVSMMPNDWAATLTCCSKTSRVEKSQTSVMQQVSQCRCTIVKSTYQLVATETKSIRYSLTRSDKGMLANDGSAGDGSGIYSVAGSRSAYVGAMTIVNCEGLNTNYSSI
jgi:hypothetical protein